MRTLYSTKNHNQLAEFPGVYTLGDCASVKDHHTGRPYPQTAQHATREGKVLAHNIISVINQKENKKIRKDVVYGGGSLGLEKSPVVIQVPDFGDRFG